MRSIKLKIVAWIIGLMTIIGTCIAQDTLTPITPFDTMLFGITVETDPVIVLVETEDLENNAPLQQMLEVETEQTAALNKYLLNLNKVIKNLPKDQIKVKQQRLDLYNINPEEINAQYRLIHIIWYSLLCIYILIWMYIVEINSNLYWTKKINQSIYIFTFIIGAFFIGYLMPKLFCLGIIDNFYLWSNLDKLF